MALSVPLSRFTSRVGGGSAFYVRHHYTLMKYTITLFTLSLLLAGCGRHLSDTDISRMAVGVWTVPHASDKMEVRSDGSYFTGTGTNVTGGSWHVEDGYVVAIVTNLPGHTPETFGHPTRYKVISIDDHQMTFIPEGQTNSVTITKP